MVMNSFNVEFGNQKITHNLQPTGIFDTIFFNIKLNFTFLRPVLF